MMKIKNLIALWLLVLWIVVTGSKPFFFFLDALRMELPIKIILWDAAVALFVGVSGLFLIGHFILMLDDLHYYEAEERRRIKELESRSTSKKE